MSIAAPAATLAATAEAFREWEPIETAPKDGRRLDLLCETDDGKNGVTVIAREIAWTRMPIGNTYGWTGKNNVFSRYLIPIMWRLHRHGK